MPSVKTVSEMEATSQYIVLSTVYSRNGYLETIKNKKNTASHFVSEDRIVSHSMGIWFISQEYSGQNIKLAKNSIYCGVKK